LEAEIFDALMDGRKTAAELVDQIYGLRRGDEGFNASRIRVAGALKVLEKHGRGAQKAPSLPR
jgi:hypothetical protein